MTRQRIVLAATFLLLTTTTQTFGQSALRVAHHVAVKDTAARLFHVTSTYSGLSQPHLDLSLPVWTPGWYTLENYARNVRQFTVKDSMGKRIATPLVASQTWRINTRGIDRITVEFDYVAEKLSLNTAKITDRFAFFTGTQLFLEPIGHRTAPSAVRFTMPPNWRVATALRASPNSEGYIASDYDELVDAPTMLGRFQQHDFMISGKRHSVVFDSAITFSADSLQRFGERLGGMVTTAAAIFGELPYEHYTIFYLPDSAEGSDGALEHGNSYVDCCGGPSGLGVQRYTAHEYFHLWNVKRIRPAEHWPYDYSKPKDSPSLWIAEGVTDYYGLMIAYRSRLTSEASVLQSVGSMLEALDREEPERRNVSQSDASMATWRAYLREPTSYYAGGFALAALLDLSILHDTRGARSLDDVMRALYTQYYMKDRGYTAQDFERTVSVVASKNYRQFFDRYVRGTELLPGDSIVAFLGGKLGQPMSVGVIGMLSRLDTAGRRISVAPPHLPGGKAGLKVGDVIVAVDGVPINRVPFNQNGCCIERRTAERVVVRIRRAGVESDVAVQMTQTWLPQPISLDISPTAEQLIVRNAWLRRAVK